MDELLMERYELAAERIKEIPNEEIAPEPFRAYFKEVSAFLTMTTDIMEREEEPDLAGYREENNALYSAVSPDNYETCWGNPDYAKEKLGEHGPLLSFLYAELRGCIAFAYEKNTENMTVALELFLEVYCSFGGDELPEADDIKGILTSYINDYCQDMVEQRTRSVVDPDLDFAYRIIMDSDLTDLRYLYRFGEYIGENEIRAAELFNTMPQEDVDSLAEVYAEGYRKGFEVT